MLILVFAIAVIIMSHASKNIGKLMKSAFETVLRGSPQAKGFDRVLAKVWKGLLVNFQQQQRKNLIHSYIVSQCQFIEGDVGRLVASLKVEEEHTNKGKDYRGPFHTIPLLLFLNLVFFFRNEGGTLHGGLSATLVDTISTLALTLPDGQNFSYGVSVNMDLSYMKAAKLGEEVLIEAKVLKRGRTLAFLEVELRNKATNELLVKGSHTKFIQL